MPEKPPSTEAESAQPPSPDVLQEQLNQLFQWVIDLAEQAWFVRRQIDEVCDFIRNAAASESVIAPSISPPLMNQTLDVSEAAVAADKAYWDQRSQKFLEFRCQYLRTVLGELIRLESAAAAPRCLQDRGSAEADPSHWRIDTSHLRELAWFVELANQLQRRPIRMFGRYWTTYTLAVAEEFQAAVGQLMTAVTSSGDRWRDLTHLGPWAGESTLRNFQTRVERMRHEGVLWPSRRFERLVVSLQLERTRTVAEFSRPNGLLVQSSIRAMASSRGLEGNGRLNPRETLIVTVIRMAGRRLTTEGVLRELDRLPTPPGGEGYTKQCLASLGNRGILNNRRDTNPPGYGFPEWT
jgi:hypothetical protein